MGMDIVLRRNQTVHVYMALHFMSQLVMIIVMANHLSKYIHIYMYIALVVDEYLDVTKID